MRKMRMIFLGLCAAVVVILIIFASGGLFKDLHLRTIQRRFPGLEMALEVLTILQDNSLDKHLKFPQLNTLNILSVDLSRVGKLDCLMTQFSDSFNWRSASKTFFRPTVTGEERLVMLLTLQVFIQVMERHNLTYFLYGGTLLGSYRHHGFVPWDDDLDVMIKTNERTQVCEALSGVPGYKTYCPKNFQWKFFREGLKPLKGFRHSWPFVDIFFLDENATHVWDELDDREENIYLKEDVFPLGRRPFEGALLPVPRSVSAVLKAEFGNVSDCKSLTYCHKSEKRVKFAQVHPCSELADMHPFVHRSRAREGFVREHLVLGDKILHTYQLPDFPEKDEYLREDEKDFDE